MKRLITRMALAASGALGGVIGCLLLFTPKQFLELSHVYVDHDPGLMSEIAAPSGLLIIAGALMVFGAIKLRAANLALSIGAIVYGSYGIGRLMSMLINGVPNESLISAMVIELAIAAALIALRLTHSSHKQRPIADTYISAAI